MFTRDLLVFDVESTGTDLDKHEIIQLAGVLLDKDTLEEKAFFNSYVKPKRWETRHPKAMESNHITIDMLDTAPDIVAVLSELEKFANPQSVLLASYTSWIDMGFLRQAYFQTGVESPYDYHCFDIWPLAYMYWNTAARIENPNKKIGFGLSDVASALGIQQEGYHNALIDARVAAEILRRLLAKLEIRN